MALMLEGLQPRLVWSSYTTSSRAPVRLVANRSQVFALTAHELGSPLLRSSDGALFEVMPTTLRAVPLALAADDDALWVVGYNGLVAKSLDRGSTWTAVRQGSNATFHSLARDTKGRVWIAEAVAEDERSSVLRALGADRPFAPVTLGTLATLELYADPRDGNPWLFGSRGQLQRWTGNQFARVSVKATKPRAHLALLRLGTGALVLAASQGTLFRSNDDGATWVELRINVKTHFTALAHTPFGLFVLGTNGVIAVSFDLARNFHVVRTPVTWRQATLTRAAGGLLIGTDQGRIYQLDAAELGRLFRAAYSDRDPLLAALASRVIDGDAGAELVLEDALRERDLW